MIQTATHTQTIQSLYAAFGRGDVATILSHLADDVDWDNTRVTSRECPWNGNFSGKTSVPGFFKVLADTMDFQAFEPRVFTEAGDHVAVHLYFEGRLKKNGRLYKAESMHLWGFNDKGLVTKYRQFNDTGLELELWAGDDKI